MGWQISIVSVRSILGLSVRLDHWINNSGCWVVLGVVDCESDKSLPLRIVCSINTCRPVTPTHTRTNVAHKFREDSMVLDVFSEVDPPPVFKGIMPLRICTILRTNKSALLNKWDGKNVFLFLSGWGGKDGTAGGIIVLWKDKINGYNFTLLFPLLLLPS